MSIGWLAFCLVFGPQVVWAEPPGEDRSPRQLRPASQHGALLLPRALAQSCALLQSQQPQLHGLTAPQALPLRPLRRGDASWEGLRFWPLHLLLLQHRRRWVQESTGGFNWNVFERSVLLFGLFSSEINVHTWKWDKIELISSWKTFLCQRCSVYI